MPGSVGSEPAGRLVYNPNRRQSRRHGCDWVSARTKGVITGQIVLAAQGRSV
jgi:hypothetical protein